MTNIVNLVERLSKRELTQEEILSFRLKAFEDHYINLHEQYKLVYNDLREVRKEIIRLRNELDNL